MNRSSAENCLNSIRVKHAVISITDPESSDPNLRLNDYCVGILRLKFHDTEESTVRDGKLLVPMSKEQAQSIVEFVVKNAKSVDSIVVHCEAGLSRSAGVAAALSLILRGTDKEFFLTYIPSMHCYRMVLDAFNFKGSTVFIKERRDLLNELS